MHIEILSATLNAGLVLTIVAFAMVAGYVVHRLVHGFRIYLKFRGARLVTCPETNKPAVVEVAAKSMGMQAFWDEPRLHLSECSRWPMRESCGQDCLRQIEDRPSELRISTAWRAL